MHRTELHVARTAWPVDAANRRDGRRPTVGIAVAGASAGVRLGARLRRGRAAPAHAARRARALQRSRAAAADRRGLRLAPFPFVEERYVLHVGRGTPRRIAESGDTPNQHFEWALGHRAPHFAGQEDGLRLYAEFCERLDAEVGDLTPASLVAACTR